MSYTTLFIQILLYSLCIYVILKIFEIVKYGEGDSSSYDHDLIVS